MQGNGDAAGLGNILGGSNAGSGLLSGIPGLSGLTGLLGGQSGLPAEGQPPVRGQFPPQGGFPAQGGFPPQGFQPQGFPPQSGFPAQQFSGFPTGPNGFARPARGAPPFQPSPPASSGFFGSIENLLFGNRRRTGRKKRQTNLQGNLIRYIAFHHCS